MAVRSLRARLNCEHLEARENPSNVTVSVNENNDVTITGGNSSNNISVFINPVGSYWQFTITGLRGTSVNGYQTYSLDFKTPENLIINEGNGNNYITVTGALCNGNFCLNSGNGNNFVNLNGLHAEGIYLFEGNGNNILVTTKTVVQDTAYLDTGVGHNVWYNYGITADELNYEGWTKIVT